MMTRSAPVLLFTALMPVLVSPLACGSGKTTPRSPDQLATVNPDGGPLADAGVDAPSSVCTGPDLDLVNVLVQSACEVPNLADGAKPLDVSTLLDVKLTPSPAQVGPGGHSDLLVTYTNKSQSPLSLSFLLDPTPRFAVEVYTSTNKRAELPRTKPPQAKGGGAPPEPSAPGTARVTLTPGGKATAKVDFTAVRLKWAPELVKGTPPEQGYPTSPAGPLAKGTYLVKVVTTLIGVFEGSDHEVSTVKATLTVQ